MNVRVEIEGLDKVLKELQRRGVEVSLGLEAICHAGAEVIQEDAAARAPGSIAEGIARETTRKTATAVTVKTGPDKAHFYAKYVEYGTSQHRIPKVRKRKRAKALKIGNRYVAWANHPGARARPFMRPAFDHGKAPAMDAMNKQTRSKMRI
jgi:HK97 gp10 family phage protein